MFTLLRHVILNNSIEKNKQKENNYTNYTANLLRAWDSNGSHGDICMALPEKPDVRECTSQ